MLPLAQGRTAGGPRMLADLGGQAGRQLGRHDGLALRHPAYGVDDRRSS